MSEEQTLPPRFPNGLGDTVITSGAALLLGDLVEAEDLFRAHAEGRWGDVPPEDVECNEYGSRNLGLVLSAHKTEAGYTVWVITDPGHVTTTILLPEEY